MRNGSAAPVVLVWPSSDPQDPRDPRLLGLRPPHTSGESGGSSGGRVLPLRLFRKGPKPGAASLCRARAHMCTCACSGSPREESCCWLSSRGGHFALHFLRTRALLGLGSQNSGPPGRVPCGLWRQRVSGPHPPGLSGTWSAAASEACPQRAAGVVGPWALAGPPRSLSRGSAGPDRDGCAALWSPRTSPPSGDRKPAPCVHPRQRVSEMKCQEDV